MGLNGPSDTTVDLHEHRDRSSHKRTVKRIKPSIEEYLASDTLRLTGF